ncbi:hypothetical protein OWV82_006966 [Melia azedarach]|uniref:Uncharacterized protein n=1 Tax=Melia azedarach TaxID=155640 RepID=A0ACC1YIV6_MELAZ|nr:hypothetical protein OWV82_006966 [Melia azedarach]
MASKTHAVKIYLPYINSSQISSGQKPETRSSIFNLFSSLILGLVLLLFRQQFVNGFAAYRSLRFALVISVMLSFVGASASLLIGIIPGQWHATIRRCSLRISSASLASAVFIMAYVLFLEIFRQVSSGFNEDGGDSFFVYSHQSPVFRKIC